MEADPREEKLPGWAREIIGELRKDLREAQSSWGQAEAENERLRAVIEGRYGGDAGDADTFYVNEDTAAEIPLGKGADVRFGDFDVHLEGDVLQVEVISGSLRIEPESSIFLSISHGKTT